VNCGGVVFLLGVLLKTVKNMNARPSSQALLEIGADCFLAVFSQKFLFLFQ